MLPSWSQWGPPSLGEHPRPQGAGLQGSSPGQVFRGAGGAVQAWAVEHGMFVWLQPSVGTRTEGGQLALCTSGPQQTCTGVHTCADITVCAWAHMQGDVRPQWETVPGVSQLLEITVPVRPLPHFAPTSAPLANPGPSCPLSLARFLWSCRATGGPGSSLICRSLTTPASAT